MSAPPPPGPYLTHAEARRVIAGNLLAMFLSALNQTIVAAALPTIGRDFDDFANLSWTVTAYLLSGTVVASLYGKLSDIHGRRAMMLTAIGVFVAGSAICALAPDMPTLIVGRAIQGLGGGGILPLSQVIIGDVSPPRDRGRYQALIGVVWVAAGVGGPMVGGLLAQYMHWSLIFWINVPLGLAAAAITGNVLKLLPRNERWHQLDIVGAMLMTLAALALLVALAWGGSRYAWFSPQILGLTAASSFLWLAFGWHLTRAAEPYLPIPILKNPVVLMGAVTSACGVSCSVGLTIFVPLYYELVHKMSAGHSGLALIPIAVMSTPGSVMAGKAMQHMHRYKRLPIAAMTLALLCAVGLAVYPTAPVIAVMAALSLIGLGVGSVIPLATVCIQNAVQLHQMGTATGVMNFCRALASAVVVAAFGAIVLVGFGVTPERGNTSAVLTAAGSDVAAVAEVFRWVFAAAALILAIGLAALIRLEERPLRGG